MQRSIIKSLRLTLFITGAVTVLLLFTQCKKDIEKLLATTSTITYRNQTFTTVDITFNGETRTIPPAGTAVFTDDANTVATGNASTSGKTTTGTQVGLLMTWSLVETFPSASSNIDIDLNVPSTYFFLKIQNNSTLSIQKVYVNYGLSSQTLDNVTVPNTGTVYTIGYYLAYTNSNVRGENGTTYWFWNPLSLPFTTNQSKTLIAN